MFLLRFTFPRSSKKLFFFLSRLFIFGANLNFRQSRSVFFLFFLVIFKFILNPVCNYRSQEYIVSLLFQISMQVIFPRKWTKSISSRFLIVIAHCLTTREYGSSIIAQKAQNINRVHAFHFRYLFNAMLDRHTFLHQNKEE